MTDQETLDSYTQQIGTLVTQNASISANTAARQTYVHQMEAEGNYTEAHKVANEIEQDEAIRTGNVAKIASLNSAIQLLQASIDAANAQATANAALTNANANLTPAQLTQLQLNKQNADAAAAAAKAKADAAAQQANFAAGNTKYYLIAGVILLLGIIALVFFSRNRNKAKSVAPTLAMAA